ncbi:hypothetical protein [Parafrankia discariae]|nr:hypothetical protein [Parafrankia discariae]
MDDVGQEYFGGPAGDSHGTAADRPPLVLPHGLSYDRHQRLRHLAN